MDVAKTPRMTASEKALVRRLHFDQGKSRSDISRLLQRSLSSISRLLAQKKAPRKIGRPQKLTEANIDRIVTTLEKMVDTADGDEEVTLHMLMWRCRVKASWAGWRAGGRWWRLHMGARWSRLATHTTS